jgi:transcriptional regulator with XRE-family HTH domain
MTFGQRLREKRAEHKVSQDVLAERTGIHPTAIGRFERGDRNPSLKSILRLARGLSIEPGELVNGLDDGAA